MQNKHIFLFLEHPSESISRNVTTAAGVSSWAPPTTLQSPEAGSSRNVPVLWIVMVIPDNMILFTLAHTTSSWSQHRPRDIIMPSLPHQRDTKYAKKSRARASVSDRRAYHQNMRLLRPGSFSHHRETIQSLLYEQLCLVLHQIVVKKSPLKERGYLRVLLTECDAGLCKMLRDCEEPRAGDIQSNAVSMSI